MGINLYTDSVWLSGRLWQMAPVVNHDVAHRNRLKAFLFPLRVPILVFSFFNRKTDGDIFERKPFKNSRQRVVVEQCLLHIAFQTILRFLECLETRFTSQCRQDVARIAKHLFWRFNIEIYFVILHLLC